MTGADDDGEKPGDAAILAALSSAEILAFPSELSRSRGKGAPPRKPPAEPPEDSGDGAGDGGGDGGQDDPIAELNREYALVLLGSRAVVMREMPEAPIEDRTRVISIEAFKAYFANRGSVVRKSRRQADGSWMEVATYVKLAPYGLSARSRRTYDGIEFFPDPQNAAGTPGYFNLWRGFACEPDAAPAVERARKYRIFRDHLLTNIADGDRDIYDWIFAWCAHIVQRPRERIGTALVLRGRQGVGKTKVGEIIGSLFPSHYFLVDDPRYLTGQFNAHMASCLLLQVDEGFWAGDKTAEGRLKGLTTAPKQMIEAKGIDPIRLDNYVRLIFSSNEDWVIPAGLEERRFCVLDVAPHAAQNHGYFGEMDAEMDNGGRAAMLADLLAYDLDAPGTPNLRVIPKTRALLEQKLRSMDHVTNWWFERLSDGTTTRRGSSWAHEVSVDTIFDDYVHIAEKIGVRRKAEKTSFGMKLRKLVPTLETRKRSLLVDLGDGSSAMRRISCFIFPPLNECRAAIETALGQSVDWRLFGTVNEENEAEDEREGL
jgi:hypothetical protein